MQHPLIHILKGCLNPNTVQQSQKLLVQYSNTSEFIPELLQLIPNQTNDMVIMILSTVKNYCQQNYKNPHAPIPESQKDVLRNNLFNLYYIISEIHQAVNLYKQIVYQVVSTDFQSHANLFYELLRQDLNGSIAASCYFSNQVARLYEYKNGDQRKPLDKFIQDWFPKIQEIVKKVMCAYNNSTRVLLTELLEMFYMVFHVEIPVYLRYFEHFDNWLLFFNAVLQAPLDGYSLNHIAVSKAYTKMFATYCRDGTDDKEHRGWAAQFRSKYAASLYSQVINILGNTIACEEVMTNFLRCLSYVVNNPDMRVLFQPGDCQIVIHKRLLPFMESNSEDNAYFKNDGLQYIRRNQDLTIHPYKKAALELIKNICEKCVYQEKSQLIKIMEHSANVLGGNSTERQKQVILIILVQIAPLVMKNKFLNENFESLVIQYFIPLLKTNSEIIVAQTLRLLFVYLKLASLSTETVTDLMAILYDKMCSSCLVTKYYAILAFTELLQDKKAVESARPHFQNILQIYVKVLQIIDHEELISSLSSIARIFANQIVSVAGDLCDHLFNMFYSQSSKQQQNQDEQVDSVKQATAALNTIKQILQSPLSHQVYYHISQKVMILLKGINSEYNEYFQQILDILNVLVFHSGNIVNFEFPYLLCRKLLQGNNGILNNCNNRQMAALISQIEVADVEYSECLLSILKNLIQKMPQDLLHQYQYSSNPQILLCMIENRKLPQSSLSCLNLQQVDQQWRLILQAYTFIVYGLGEVPPLNQLKMLTGISLYPWLEHQFDLEVVKRLLNTLEEQDGEDEFYEENTVQMLQHYANQQDDDADFYASSGGNYSFMYTSPFSSSKDAQFLVNKIKQLPRNQFDYIWSNLKPKNLSKLQELIKM